jgi:Multiple resistance and pH regulation protein F (MrpF / PhaF).
MFKALLLLSLILLTVAILLNMLRLVRGPSTADRVQALDAMGIQLISGISIYSIYQETTAYFDLILLIGILSFIGTIAFARYLERGAVIERKR